MGEIEKRISELKRLGKTPEEIYLTLLQSGSKVEDINKYLNLPGPNPSPSAADTRQKTIQAIVVIGSILIGVGVFSFVAANWKHLDSTTKIFIILASMCLAYFTGWYLSSKGNKITGRALIFLGAIIYGAGIFLVGQTFHLQTNWPDGFVLWMLGIIPLGLVTKNYSILFLAAITGIVSLISHPQLTFTPERIDYLFTSTWLLAAAAAASLFTLHHLSKNSTS